MNMTAEKKLEWAQRRYEEEKCFAMAGDHVSIVCQELIREEGYRPMDIHLKVYAFVQGCSPGICFLVLIDLSVVINVFSIFASQSLFC